MAKTLSRPRRYDSSGRQSEARERRRAIVAAAARLFLDNGYAETSIPQIAAEAGVSPQLVYAAFGGKAGLLAAANDAVAAGDDEPVLLRDRPESLALLDIPDMRERLRAAAAQMTDLNTRAGPMLHLVERVAGSDPAVAELRANLLAAMREDYRVIADRMLTGLRPDLGPERLAEMARVITGYQVWHALVVDGGWTRDQYEEWLADTLIRLLVDEPPRTSKESTTTRKRPRSLGRKP
jgi:TetR/AcrR family transcriptional regulator of autoinduction and epiphytic fitness